MATSQEKYWFLARPKKHGRGFAWDMPHTWQGRLVTYTIFSAMLAISVWGKDYFEPALRYACIGGLIVLFVLIVVLKGEPQSAGKQ